MHHGLAGVVLMWAKRSWRRSRSVLGQLPGGRIFHAVQVLLPLLEKLCRGCESPGTRPEPETVHLHGSFVNALSKLQADRHLRRAHVQRCERRLHDPCVRGDLRVSQVCEAPARHSRLIGSRSRTQKSERGSQAASQLNEALTWKGMLGFDAHDASGLH